MSFRFSEKRQRTSADNHLWEGEQIQDPKELVYSSGESPENELFERNLKQLSKPELEERMLYLWNLTYRKARGAALLVTLYYQEKELQHHNGFKRLRSLATKVDTTVAPQAAEKQYFEELKNVSCLISPKSKYKQRWDILVMLLLLYTAIWVPYKVCFEDTLTSFEFALDIVVDSLFLLDIILTFFTMYEKPDGKYELKRLQIAKNYLRGYFLLDFVTTFPYQLLEKAIAVEASGSGTDNLKMLRIMRIQRLYKLFRIFRLLKLFRLIRLSKSNILSYKFEKVAPGLK